MNDRFLTSQILGVTVVAVVAAPGALAEQPPAAVQSFQFHHADVLGTAMELTVVAPSRADAEAAENAVVTEIQRLQKILSAYDPDSELAKLNRSPVNGPAIPASPELVDVLKRYDTWFKRTDGAYSGHAGAIISLWKEAEKSNRLPSDEELLAAATRSKAPAWEIDAVAKTVRRISDAQINVDSLGKGYVIDKAIAAATRTPTPLKGILLNIGGDLATWGSPTGAPGAVWTVAVQDPAHPELNAKPLTTLYISGNQSVSSSGAYQRFYTIDGKRYSHIVDARTGESGRNQAATVVAADSAIANALATICCTMKFTEAFELVRATPGAQAMIVTADGTPLSTDGFKELQDRSLAQEHAGPKLPSPFPAGFALSIDLETTATQRRPYVFAWITDSAGKYVKTLAAYGNEPKWMREMHEWWKYGAANRALQSATHATQRAGKYPLTWDGTNQQGAGVAPGKYTVWVEVGSEHGPYAAKSGSIEIGSSPASATIARSSAFSEVKLNFGPGAK